MAFSKIRSLPVAVKQAHQVMTESREPVHSRCSSAESAKALTPAQCCTAEGAQWWPQNDSRGAQGLRLYAPSRISPRSPRNIAPLTPAPWLRRNRKDTRSLDRPPPPPAVVTILQQRHCRVESAGLRCLQAGWMCCLCHRGPGKASENAKRSWRGVWVVGLGLPGGWMS